MIVIPLRPHFEPPRHEHAVYVEGCARCVTKQIMAQREMLSNNRSFEEELIQAMLRPIEDDE